MVSGLAERLERTDGADEQLMAVAAAVAEAFRSPYVGVEVDSVGRPAAGRRARPPARPRSSRCRSPTAARRSAGCCSPGTASAPSWSPGTSGCWPTSSGRPPPRPGPARWPPSCRHSREQLVAAREEERRRLRRDLHDGLGPSLGAVVLRIDTARNLAGAGRPEEADRLLRQARDDVAAALADVRRLVHDLRPPALDDLGLAGAVRQQAERLLAPRAAVTVDARPGRRRPARRRRGRRLPDRVRGAGQRRPARAAPSAAGVGWRARTARSW